ncbi:hypothetical protein OF377_01505 [Ureaplasma sp. ES3154-GEN]|uniref:hypothetical protein n=1 Tax=Ureaplasma sp. ES3154-GEN TaxID=2984844 RepID=UPI0021E8476E|nr:hypothetical protein [Ureaplasma sp. ES3154-GEN]MCV3743562.1 hypothetical protein [Ureaplasma sp. ES3154-GEN]
MVKQKHKHYFSFDKHLRTIKGLVISWSIIFTIILLYSIVFGVIIHFLSAQNLNVQDAFIVNRSYLTNPTKNIIYAGYAMLYFPLLFLIGCWINGINNVHKSVYFHWLIWFLYVVATILLIIAMTLITNIYIYI